MSTDVCTKERFIDDTKEHRIMIIRDEGSSRHIRINKVGTWNQGYDIITWPNHLCYTGDMGTYVFSRVEDMFCFFRQKELSIKPMYWAEKCLSESRFGEGIQEWSVESFRKRVLEHMMYVLNVETIEEIPEEYMEEAYSLLQAEDEYECVAAYRDFDSKLFDLTDVFDGFSGKEYTYNFIWCLYAIVFAISRYDEKKEIEQ